MTGCLLLALTLPSGPPTSAAAPPANGIVRELEYRRGDLAADPTQRKMDLAAWAVENGLDDQADHLYRQILRSDPLHRKAHAELVRLAASHALPHESQAYDAARKLLPPRFRDYETKRFILLSDARGRWSRDQAEQLERAVHQFGRFAKRLGLRPLPLRHKLVCVLFRRRDDYQQFARAHDAVTDPLITGYYSPKNDRVVFYDPDSESVLRPARPAVGMRGERALASSSETTLHEAIHQLLFHTCVQSPMVEYPLWICEGLATAFETDAPNKAFGPDHDYPPRRRHFRRALKRDELLELRRLVRITRMPDADEETVQVIYHQSYALVTWMFRFRKRELGDYLLAMLAEPSGRPSADRHLEIFEAAFGDAERLERAWLGHERVGMR